MKQGTVVNTVRRGSFQLLLGWLLLSLFLGGCAATQSPGSSTEQALAVPQTGPSAIPPQVSPGSPEPPVVPTPSDTPVSQVVATTQAPPPATTIVPLTKALILTPVPATTEAPPDRCAIQATRTPGPNAPTYVAPSSISLTLTPEASEATVTPRYVDPHIEICASAYAVKVGQLVTIMGYPVDLGLPYYKLLYKTNPNAGTPGWILEVTHDNQLKYLTEGTEPLEFDSVAASNWWVEIVLRAVRPGTAGYYINATGEIHYGYPGPATWAGGGSETIVITVE